MNPIYYQQATLAAVTTIAIAIEPAITTQRLDTI